MALEKKLLAISPRPLMADGSSYGVVTLSNNAGFRLKQEIYLKATTLPDLRLQVKYFISKTQMVVGLSDNKIGKNRGVDISAYTLGQASQIGAPEQDKNQIPDKDHYNAIYEADPVVADRVILVDENGDFYGEDNPLPIAFDGTVSIGDVHVEGTNGNTLEPNEDGSINVNFLPSTDSNNTVKNTFGVAHAVIGGSITTVVQYTVPMGKTALLQRVVGSGENIGTYTLQINSVTQSIMRTYFFGPFNCEFDFTTGQDNGLVLQPSDLVKLTVLHNRPFTGDFDGRIQVFEIVIP